MKVCPTCQNQYPDDANFCPREECAGVDGPQRLKWLAAPPATGAALAAAGRFTLVSRIGNGPTGELWQASDSETGAAVAYRKVADGIFASPLLKERCLRELRQLQRATSPRIARVIEAGRGADGTLFVVSELVPGEPLDRVVGASGPVPLERAKRIVAQIGEALLDGQKVGLVHRDLNAKNILLLADDSVKVLNFAFPQAPTDHPLGVAEYMSPEQAEGKLVDQRSNTYSLGAILYLLVAGAAPVSGGSPAEVIEAIIKGEVTPPSIRRGGGGLTAEVDRVILKALDKSSSRRPLTLRQFLGEVAGLVASDEEHLLSGAVQARQPPPGSSGPAPKEASGATAAGEVGFTRTVMFAGGAPEIQKLVSDAIAARDSAAAADARTAGGAVIQSTGPATPSPSTPNGRGEDRSGGHTSPAGDSASAAALGPGAGPTRPLPESGAAALFPVVPRAAGAAATSATPAADEISGAATPPPSTLATGAPARAFSEAAAPPAGGNFRETLWFKKGDVDQMVAEARAKMAEKAAEKAADKPADKPADHAADKAAARGALEPLVAPSRASASPEAAFAAVPASDSGPASSVDVKPLEERYVDDGTVTVDDRKKFSLRSGPTSSGHAVRGAAVVPGERMSESEVLEEIGGGRRLLVLGVVLVLGLVAAGLVWTLTKGSAPSPAQAPATAASPPPPAEAPSAPAPPTSATAAPTPPSSAPAAPPSAEGASGAGHPAPGPSPPPAEHPTADLAPSDLVQPESVSSKAAARKKASSAKKKAAASAKKPASSSTKPRR